MKYAYFPGCSANSTGISYSMSVDYMCRKLGVGLEEIPDWNCCGTSAARITDRDMALALPARSLALSEKMDPELSVFAPCAGCYSSLKTSATYAKESDENRQRLEDIIEMPYEAQADVVNILDILADPEVLEAIKTNMVKRFEGLKVASYYGCALVRPEGMCQQDSTENPMVMDNVVELIGGTPVEWSYKTECCGASNHITYPEASKPMVERIFRNAAANGADIIVTACPLCWMNLDMREAEVNKLYNREYDIPVYYVSELIGAALGGSFKELGCDKHFRPAERLFDHLQDVPATDAAAQKEVVA